MNTVLGPLLEIPTEERDLLLLTLRTYFSAGSITAAGEQLYCHRNTVRHRLMRIKQLTGRSVDDPLGAVELYLASQTMLCLPKPTD
jgi:DNA-binding PucR family transcriptional regulator